MSTIYTLNGKVLKNAANNKWLIKAVPPPPPEEVTIGTQTWKMKNLAIDDGQGGIYTQTVNYGQGDVVEYYYTWDAAVRVAATVEGWHLPTTSDLDTLATTVGGSSTAGTYLKSSYGWSSGNGTDAYGFSALPAGGRISGSFMNFGSYAILWSGSQYSSTKAYYRFLTTAESMSSYRNVKTDAFSVRLVKDSE